MTGGAIVTRGNVGHPFATGTRAIMTSYTGFACKTVVEHGHRPCSTGVTTVATQGCWNVIHAHTRGNDTIMATDTGADDFIVIH